MSENSALLVIDVQNDFCEGGALAVDQGSEIIAPINALMGAFDTVVFSQDWHPENHLSFASNHKPKKPYDLVDLPYGPQVLWPDHCIQGTIGAEFHSQLNTNPANIIVRKGFRAEIDSYSAFFENDQRTVTGLDGYLKSRKINHVTVVGLALDFCVQYTALDARKLGYDVDVILEGCKAIDLNGSRTAALEAMRSVGVSLK